MRPAIVALGVLSACGNQFNYEAWGIGVIHQDVGPDEPLFRYMLTSFVSEVGDAYDDKDGVYDAVESVQFVTFQAEPIDLNGVLYDGIVDHWPDGPIIHMRWQESDLHESTLDFFHELMHVWLKASVGYSDSRHLDPFAWQVVKDAATEAMRL